MCGLILVISPSSRYALCKYKTAIMRAGIQLGRHRDSRPPSSVTFAGFKRCDRFSDVLSISVPTPSPFRVNS